jgi:lipoate-protein ligase A
VLAGHKILGSAQRRRKGAILQHGSLLLRRSPWTPQHPGLQDVSPLGRFDIAKLANVPLQLAEHVEFSSLTPEERANANRKIAVKTSEFHAQRRPGTAGNS